MMPIAVKATHIAKARPQIILLQLNILCPSKIPTGKRLNAAMYALKKPPKKKIGRYGPVAKAMPRNSIDKMMLTAGPAMDISPISSLSAAPAIITAPGEINLIGRNAKIRVITEPHSVNLNSDQRPLL